MSPEDTAQVMVKPPGATGRAFAQYGVSLGLSLCSHRQRPHLLLLQLHAPHHPAQQHHLCLHDQQQVQQARSDVSIQYCRASGCNSQGSTPSMPKGGWEGEGGTARDSRGTVSRTQCRHPTALAKLPSVGFLLAAWSPKSRDMCVQILRHAGYRTI